jgi:hypothetical protein
MSRNRADFPQAHVPVPLGQRLDALAVTSSSTPRHAEIERQEVLGIGAQVVLDDAHEAVDQQAGGNQQHEGQRDLSGYEQAAHTLPLRASSRASP